jgi:ABC-type transport system involved in multi-copper enzyme maturation permease subunit
MRALTRHFFQEFFRLSFLDDAGEEAFTRVLIGVLAAFIAVGLWLPRIVSMKYAGGFATQDAYLRVVLADQLLMLVLPMFIVAFAMALVVQSLFPDELDYRVLMALPIERRTIFASKLTALFLYASLFVFTTNVAFGVPFAMVSRSAWAPHAWPLRAACQVAAGLCASSFTVAAVVALQGLIVVFSPRVWLRQASIATQTAIVCGLVVLFPVALRFAASFDALPHASPATAWLPPVWFVGVEELLMGNVRSPFPQLAGFAAAGTASLALLTAVCYAIVYRRFDQVIVQNESTARPRRPVSGRTGPFSRSPEHEAVAAFAGATLRRLLSSCPSASRPSDCRSRSSFSRRDRA